LIFNKDRYTLIAFEIISKVIEAILLISLASEDKYIKRMGTVG